MSDSVGVARRPDLDVARGESGVIMVILALMLPLFFLLGGAVIAVGSWWTHGRHLQTQVDAAALAGGGVWGFPCAGDIDQRIEDTAREYVGDHTGADLTPHTGGYNSQVSGVDADKLFVAINQSQWWDDGFGDDDFTDPSDPVCTAQILDVKATEDNTPFLFGWLPLWPDVKRKARLEVREVEGLSGILPIAVRIPRPLSAAAVFYDEATGLILDVQYMCEKAGGLGNGMPTGLSGWTTLDTANTQGPNSTSLCTTDADFDVAPTTGVVVATSFRPACDADGATGLCLEDSGWINDPVNDFCRQASGVVSCWDATGPSATQTVQGGVQFIRGYGTSGGPTPPQIRSSYIQSNGSCNGYFNSVAGSCVAILNVEVDVRGLLGNYPNPLPPPAPAQIQGPLRAEDVQVRYRLVRGDGTSYCDNYGNSCSLDAPDTDTGVVTFRTEGTPASPHLDIPADSWANSVAIEIRLRNAVNSSNSNCAGSGFTVSCGWYYLGGRPPSPSGGTAPTAAEILAAPIQRSFSGSVDRTGPLKWTRLTADLGPNCDGVPNLGMLETVEAASVPTGRNCFYFEMGLQGGLALDQDEPPIAFNLGSTGSQRALIDCDDTSGSNLASEIQYGCPDKYAAHQFTYTPECPPVNSITALLSPQAAPWDATNGWPPAGGTRCVITQTGASNQILPGLNQRLFGVSNNPQCPAETGHFVPGRNYWHDANNDYQDTDPETGLPRTDIHTFFQDSPGPRGNRLRVDDPRLVTLFLTPYASFSSTGNEVFPIVGFGGFYITGYGRTTGGGGNWQGGAPEDPCIEGNQGNIDDGLPLGQGNEPPPDMSRRANQTWVWGHFINPVLLSNKASPADKLCSPGTSFQPCVAALVE